MANLTRRTVSDSNYILNESTQTSGSPLDQQIPPGPNVLVGSTSGYNVTNRGYVSDTPFAAYGFSDPYGLALSQRYLGEGGFLQDFQPISTLWNQIAQTWNPTGSTLNAGNVNVTIDWDLGIKQSTVGTPEYARKIIRESNPAGIDRNDPLFFLAEGYPTSVQQKTDYLIQTMNPGSWSNYINNTLAGGQDFSRTGELYDVWFGRKSVNVAPVEAVWNAEEGAYNYTLTETVGAFGLPALRAGERYAPLSVSNNTGTIYGPQYSLTKLSPAEKAFQNEVAKVENFQSTYGYDYNEAIGNYILSKAHTTYYPAADPIPSGMLEGYTQIATKQAADQGWLNSTSIGGNVGYLAALSDYGYIKADAQLQQQQANEYVNDYSKQLSTLQQRYDVAKALGDSTASIERELATAQAKLGYNLTNIKPTQINPTQTINKLLDIGYTGRGVQTSGWGEYDRNRTVNTQYYTPSYSGPSAQWSVWY